MKTSTRSVANKQAAPRKPVNTKPTRKEFMHYLELNQRRKDLEKQAREIAKDENPIAEKITNYLDEQKVRVGESIRLYGFDVGFEEGGKYPAWKQLFIEWEGQEEADKIVKETPNKICLSISKA